MRLDIYLVKNQLCTSRQRGRYLIDNSMVTVDGKICTKASFDVEGKTVLVVGEDIPYVSRGGLKLEAALDSFNIDVNGLAAVDIGSSTGGFTDCLLQRGAKEVFCVDSGSNQLHPSLRNNSRVRVIENFNAKALTLEHIGKTVDIAVMDVSFISQGLLYKGASLVLGDDGIFISLIKPQFEAGRAALNKKGIASDKNDHIRVIRDLMILADEYGFGMISLICSPIKGGDGNTEYLAYFRKGHKPQISETDIKKTVYGI